MNRWILALVLVLGCRSRDDDAAVPDADTRCEACGPDQICVQVLGSISGVCPSYVQCQDRNPACTGTTCSPDCDFWHCRGGQDAGGIGCSSFVRCDNELPGALHCYGP